MADAPNASAPNASEAEYWGSTGGQKWVEHQGAMDRLLGGVTDALLAEARPQPGEKALDLGCGAGASALALAPLLEPGGSVRGVDISPVLLDLARRRAKAAGSRNLEFVQADAQTFAFEPLTFDLLISRFGSMFFSDPVAAFANIRQALRPGGRVCLAAWAPLAQNPWFYLPRVAAIARLGPSPQAGPHEPGAFAFADQAYVTGILRNAGFGAVEAKAVPVDLIAPDTPEKAADLTLNIGPAARMLGAENGAAEDSQAIAAAIADVFSAFRTQAGVRIPAVINLFTARCP